jgi:hypothetical protein
VKLWQFMTTPELAGEEFSGPSWATWRIIARLIDGDAHLLTPDEQALALQLTGRTKLPTVPAKEIYVGAGRRSGKSRFGSLVAVWLAAQEYPQLAPGENAVVVDVAPDRRQAAIDLEYSRGIVDGSEPLAAELANATADVLTVRHRTQLEVATASYRTVRGRTLAGAVVDESAYLRSDDSALPDQELARALRPALLTLNGLLLVISSPHRKVGLLHDAYKRFHGNDSATRGLYIQASSRQLNPRWTRRQLPKLCGMTPRRQLASISVYSARTCRASWTMPRWTAPSSRIVACFRVSQVSNMWRSLTRPVAWPVVTVSRSPWHTASRLLSPQPFDRLEGRLRDDPERLAQLRADRRAVTKVLEERQVSFEHAHEMLSTYYEHLNIKRSVEAIAQRWPGEWERIRLAAGSTEAAEQVLKDADQFYKAISAAAPQFAEAVKASGAAEHSAMIQAAARYPNIPTPPPAAASEK